MNMRFVPHPPRTQWARVRRLPNKKWTYIIHTHMGKWRQATGGTREFSTWSEAFHSAYRIIEIGRQFRDDR